MDLALALSHVSCFLLVAAALVVANHALRQVAIANLMVSAGLTLIAAFRAEGTRTLTTTHSYAGYEGSNLEISMVSFPTFTHEATAGHWALPYTGFAVLWMAILLSLKSKPVKNPWLLPLLLAWSALATWLAMQLYAAPSVIVQPFGIDRFLWPAGAALSLLAAQRASSIFRLMLMVGGGIMLARLPAALFSKYASDAHIGTCLDISQVRDIVNPMNRMQFEPRLQIGSGEQQFWLIWLEHVIFFPAIYLMSLMGLAFGAFMFKKHGSMRPAAT